MGCASVLTTKPRPEEHAATIRNKHNPNTHWLEETLLSSHYEAIAQCYHQRQIHIATTRSWRVPVSLPLQRDCQTSRAIWKRYPTNIPTQLNFHGRDTYDFVYACWQQLQKIVRGLCKKCLSSLRSDPLM